MRTQYQSTWQAATALLGLLGAMLAAWPGNTSSREKPEPRPVAIEVGKDQIDFRSGDRLVARYNFGPKVAKPFFWPVHGPDGTPLTRGWPMAEAQPGEAVDHVHQKSLWFCHGDVIPEGLELKSKIKGIEGVDFWSEAPGHGRIACTKVSTDAGARSNIGSATTLNEWQTAEGDKVLDEKRVLGLVDLGGAFLLTFDIDLHASVAALTFGDTKEGSLGVRMHQELTASKGAKGKLTNADGKTGELGCWGQASAWCDDSGPIGTKTAGIAVFAHPDNPLATSWHARGYGLMAANPFGREKSGFPAMKGKTERAKLAKGEHLRLRYGILLHQGDVEEGQVAEMYKKYVALK